MRKSTAFCLLLSTQASIATLFSLHAAYRLETTAPIIAQETKLVRDYGLTDLCLFTEARYTRHPALADLHSPFQDGPLSFEHFPSGALSAPPPSLARQKADD